jgi:HPt (histidine-containing phosphotransfer) domain-containing protein
MPFNPMTQGKSPASPERAQPQVTDPLEDIDWSDLQDFFFEHLRTQLDQMSDLLARADLPTLTRIGHSLKGSGGGVQLPRFSDLGRDLEDAGRSGDVGAVESACRAIRDEYLQHRPADQDALGRMF